MTSHPADVEPAAGLAPYPVWRRAIDVFVAPGRLFERFRYETPWFGALAVVVVIGVLSVLAVPEALFVEQTREALRQAAEQGAPMPSVEQMASLARVAAAAGAVIGSPIMAFIVAGLLSLAFSILGGGSATYAQYLTVTTHAMLIMALGGLVTLAVQILAGDLSVRLSLALFAPGLEEGESVRRVLQGLELFTIWALVVTGFGVAVLNRRPSWAAPTGVVVGLYVFMLVAIALITT